MPAYTYSRLDPSSREIRVMSILPGRGSDPIQLEAKRVRIYPKQHVQSAPDAAKMEATLPTGWYTFVTLDDQYLYQIEATAETFWEHPDPEHRRALEEAELARKQKELQGPQQPVYEALSYTWGSSVKQATVLIRDAGSSNGPTSGDFRTLEVTENLAIVLPYLRYADRPRDIWIDALSINQSDNDEKNAQVALMRPIFELASRVVIWLGEEKNDSLSALAMLENIAEDVLVTRDHWLVWHPNYVKRNSPFPYSEPGMPHISDAEWSAVIDLIMRPWFQRIWVIQEAAVANQDSIVQCGHHQTPWTLFRRGVSRLFVVDKPFPDTAKMTVEEFHQRLAQAGDVTTRARQTRFLDLLKSSKRKLATDPRDKVYGMLGMAPSYISDVIQPDYGKSWSSVYLSTVTQYIAATGDLDVVLYCDIASKLNDAPSWVPNWNSEHQPVGRDLTMVGDKCKALVSYKAPNRLLAKGVFCGAITGVSAPLPEDVAMLGGILEAYMTAHYSRSAEEEKKLDSLLATLARGRLKERWPWFGYYPERLALREAYRKNDSKALVQALRPNVPVDKVLLTTSLGEVGLGNQTSQPGDQVSFLVGCVKPIVLRPTPEGSFQVVGDCYFEAYEDEKALLGPLPAGYSVQMDFDRDGVLHRKLYNNATEALDTQDPRLPSLPGEWKEDSGLGLHDGTSYFRNDATGEITMQDPRLTCDALKARGVELKSLTLV